ncbi:response regulator transcription factor [Ferroacidibacillus organovorans]|uniref:DNA-binding response regulator n=1 Tax=Ferroacidibacillus organovorans TaxID=1765683 RepID=A0A162UG09_9BACL|nr:response regulator transcription factor [Ferroacidibacillus organovorans]KYP81727.1 DNA-binding response regulator [Ferroacidibacillus organovorans]OAG94250.1 hypothetical protein AYW79_06440 [Ferroacidibacillus organovorans]OPG16915.1 DNA-binding response regulator [Ferroacidibacillus organovorans]
MSQKLLVVDDEESIRTLVRYNLVQAGFDVTLAEDGEAGFQQIQQDTFDLLILDLMMPGMSGLEICKRMRQMHKDTPIIMLTARGEEIDRVLGLEMGADDYITKPFSPRELVARVRAVLRRKGEGEREQEQQEIFQVGTVRLDVSRYEVTVDGKLIDLTPREFDLLYFLLQHTDRVVSRDQLLDRVWGYDYAGDTRLVDVHVSHLREKIERDPKSPRYIKTVRGVGYKFTRSE